LMGLRAGDGLLRHGGHRVPRQGALTPDSQIGLLDAVTICWARTRIDPGLPDGCLGTKFASSQMHSLKRILESTWAKSSSLSRNPNSSAPG